MAKRLKFWHRRLLFVQAIALCTVSLKLLVNITDPTQTLFPIRYDSIDLDHWQNSTKKQLTAATIKEIIPGDFRGGIEQSFTQQQNILTIKRATISQSNGDLKKYLKNYSNDLLSTLNYRADMGHYAVFTQGDRLTMMACFTADNQTTVTADQFKVAQIKATFNPSQLWQWLLNREQLVPHTCTWRSLSISPITPDSAATLLKIWHTLDHEPKH